MTEDVRAIRRNRPGRFRPASDRSTELLERTIAVSNGYQAEHRNQSPVGSARRHRRAPVRNLRIGGISGRSLLRLLRGADDEALPELQRSGPAAGGQLLHA